MSNNGKIRDFTKHIPKTVTFTRLFEVVTHSGHSIERVCPIHLTELVSDTRSDRMPYALGRGTAPLSKFSPIVPDHARLPIECRKIRLGPFTSECTAIYPDHFYKTM